MNRRRNSTTSNAKRRRKGAEIVNYSGPSFSNLPNNILVNILLRLTVKRILVCKCVCKMWCDLISDPEFAKLHFSQARVHTLLRTAGFTCLSRMLYLVHPGQDDFGPMHKMVFYKVESPIKIKLDSKLKLPLNNIPTILDKEGAESKNCTMKLNMKNHKYKIVNSCNGLLCLSNPSDNDPVIVCNPVTGEFINLPEVRTVNDLDLPIDCGFGFSPVTNKYKVIRMFTRWTEQGKLQVAEVHVLGTESWKDLAFFPKSMDKLFPTYLNGCVYWFSASSLCCVICFDIEKECFESIPLPKLAGFDLVSRVNMGVLGGELVISEAYGSLGDVYFWVMKDNGGEKSLSGLFSFGPGDYVRWPHGSYQSIMYLDNGALLMFHSRKNALICKRPEKNGYKYLKVRGLESKVEAIAHVPSFVSLKHALSGHNAEVLNIKSRCANLKLHRESKGVSIVEEDISDSDIDTNDMDDQEYDYEDGNGILSFDYEHRRQESRL